VGGVVPPRSVAAEPTSPSRSPRGGAAAPPTPSATASRTTPEDAGDGIGEGGDAGSLPVGRVPTRPWSGYGS